ncbi:MAG: type II toxin-antitoxin system RelE/ParE family toxin [Bacteroidota bacterium]|nr:type II toxin-antitoxin system RelE/ParE family toxin [Bacteroidota bacterium]
MEKSILTNYSFHPEAEQELIESVNYYNDCEPGLGHDFSIEVYAAICRVIAQPKAWQILRHGVRRSLVSRFPYGVLYYIEKNEIVILAVMHLSRKPNYWKKRKK